MRVHSLNTWLATLTIAHFVVSGVHGVAHSLARVSQGPAAVAFVIVVILLGPLAGLALTRVQPRAGAALIAATTAGGLLFGLVNHFVLPGADHVTHVDAEWRALFGATAALLAVMELAAVVVGAMAVSRHEGGAV